MLHGGNPLLLLSMAYFRIAIKKGHLVLKSSTTLGSMFLGNAHNALSIVADLYSGSSNLPMRSIY
jgi:predicted transglutaminase-like cysteine proteinase